VQLFERRNQFYPLRVGQVNIQECQVKVSLLRFLECFLSARGCLYRVALSLEDGCQAAASIFVVFDD